MKKTILTVFTVFCLAVLAMAQEPKDTFTPGGSASVKIFTDFRSTTTGGKTASAFEITRAYFGYGYNFSKEFSGKITFDVGDPGVGGLQMTAYLKNASLQYSAKGFTANFGLISTTQFGVQEDFWANRYVQKTFQDMNGINPSADLGLGLAYKFAKYVQVDVSFYNGEGYKKLQSDSAFQTALGLTLTPVKGLIVRGSTDFMSKKSVTQSNTSAFVGYSASKFSLAFEYNHQKNQKMVNSHDVSGPSVYGSFSPVKKVKIYARYDKLSSNTLAGKTTAWNLSKDGSLIIAGLEYAPVKGVKLSPNFQGWNPADSSKPNSSSLMLNCEIKF